MTSSNHSEHAYDLVVIGLGYVGLPLVLQGVKRGLRVGGLDLSASVVAALMSGKSHVDDVNDDEIQEILQKGFVASTDETLLSRAKAIVICVPTPLSLDGSPDLSAVHATSASIVRNIRPGTLVSLESTTSPGTTEEFLVPALESTGLKVGEDIFVVFSPERIDPGNQTYTLENTPKVVGGATAACLQRGIELYENLVAQVVPLSGTKEAELCKLLENTYRQVNIALVNELSKYCHELGIDIWEVIRGASTKPFGFQAFSPGPGIGGHCIPIDPSYLSYTVNAKLGYPFRIVELAQEVNNSMPQYIVQRVQEQLNLVAKAVMNSNIVVVGITYKADISDCRESPSTPIVERLLALGAHVQFVDSFHSAWSVSGNRSIPSTTVAEISPDAVDLVILLQHHSDLDVNAIRDSGCLVLDTRGRLSPSSKIAVL